MKQIFKNISGEVLIIALFVIIPLLYFSPMLEGKRLIPGDTQKFKGMSKELRDFQEKQGRKLYGLTVCSEECQPILSAVPNHQKLSVLLTVSLHFLVSGL